MATKWIPTAHKGLRYYEHPTRRHGKKKDRYYAVRFRCDKELYEYGVGWWSDDIPEEARRNDPDMGFEEYVALLSLHCGLRFGEISTLTWSCINPAAGTLAILNAKTGSRTAYLTGRAKEMLQARKRAAEKAKERDGKEVSPDELIFPKRTQITGGAMAQASKSFPRVVEELGLNRGITDRKQRVTFHRLRHSFATLLYESAHDLYLTQRSLGHATGAMTARYAKMSESRLREGAAALEKAFAANAAKQAEQEQAEQVVNFTK